MNTQNLFLLPDVTELADPSRAIRGCSKCLETENQEALGLWKMFGAEAKFLVPV